MAGKSKKTGPLFKRKNIKFTSMKKCRRVATEAFKARIAL